MNRRGENTPKLLSRLAYRLVGKQHPTIRRSPAPQTSLIFQLPDELILAILSHIAPDPHLTGHYARYCVQYCMDINDNHQRRMEFLLPLSGTCRKMRLRLVPWIWDHIQPSRASYRYYGGERTILWPFPAITQILSQNNSLARVKFMTVHYLDYGITARLVECLKSLPNLHTLEIGSSEYNSSAYSLERVLTWRVVFPQIKTLIIPEFAYPLLKRCPNVEDVVCVIRDTPTTSDKFLRSLPPSYRSKAKRLTIPLVLPCNPSRYVAACPRLIELTVIYPHPYPRPHPHRTTDVKMRMTPYMVETICSEMRELVKTCKALPNFDTLQIVHFSLSTPLPMGQCWLQQCSCPGPYTEQQKQRLREEMQGVKDWTMDCLKEPETGYQRQVRRVNDCVAAYLRLKRGRKKTTLRVIELNSAVAPSGPRRVYGYSQMMFHLGSVKFEQYKV